MGALHCRRRGRANRVIGRTRPLFSLADHSCDATARPLDRRSISRDLQTLAPVAPSARPRYPTMAERRATDVGKAEQDQDGHRGFRSSPCHRGGTLAGKARAGSSRDRARMRRAQQRNPFAECGPNNDFPSRCRLACRRIRDQRRTDRYLNRWARACRSVLKSVWSSQDSPLAAWTRPTLAQRSQGWRPVAR